MSKLYISAFEDNGMTLWGLFYEDKKGIHHLTENFKPVSLPSEEAAKAKLEAIEQERRSEDAAIAFSQEEAKLLLVYAILSGQHGGRSN